MNTKGKVSIKKGGIFFIKCSITILVAVIVAFSISNIVSDVMHSILK